MRDPVYVLQTGRVHVPHLVRWGVSAWLSLGVGCLGMALTGACRSNIPIDPEHLMRPTGRVAADLDLEAWAAIDRGDLRGAEERYRRALHLRLEALGPGHPDVALALSNTGWALQGQERFAEAETLHRQALDIRRSVFGEEHPAVARSLTGLGACLTGQRRYTAAEEVLIEALSIYDNLPPPPHPSRFVTLRWLVHLYDAWSKPELVEQYRAQLYPGASSSD